MWEMLFYMILYLNFIANFQWWPAVIVLQIAQVGCGAPVQSWEGIFPGRVTKKRNETNLIGHPKNDAFCWLLIEERFVMRSVVFHAVLESCALCGIFVKSTSFEASIGD
jgi:hypothetical protein